MRLQTLKLPSTLEYIVQKEDSFESTLKKFKKAVRQSGHLMELRHKERWETAAEKRKRKAQNAKRINRYERISERAGRIARGEIYVLPAAP